MVRTIDAVLEKARRLAAQVLQAPEAALRFADGRFALTDDAADPAYRCSTSRARRRARLMPRWTAISTSSLSERLPRREVELDPETGHVRLDRYTAVDDYGRLVNPMLTIGQVQGGLAQGIGQAMLEEVAYDPQSGQILAASLMTTACRAPRICRRST